MKCWKSELILGKLSFIWMKNIEWHCMWHNLKLRWDSIQIQLSLGGLIEFWIQIPNIQIHGMTFKFHWIRYFWLNLIWNSIGFRFSWREMRCKLMHEVFENMLLLVVLKKIASKNADPKNTFLSYLEQILNQNLFLYLWNLNLSTLYKLRCYHHHWN